MFSQFFASLQQDAKLFLFFPILCALFRAIFIKVYSPYPNFAGKGKILWHTFRYGFWWGMDFNAYVFLISLVLVSLPGAFFLPILPWAIHCVLWAACFMPLSFILLSWERCSTTAIFMTSTTRP